MVSARLVKGAYASLSVCDLEKVEWGKFEDVDDPGESPLGAVGKQHHLQTTRHQGTVEDILLQQHLMTHTHTHTGYIYFNSCCSQQMTTKTLKHIWRHLMKQRRESKKKSILKKK